MKNRASRWLAAMAMGAVGVCGVSCVTPMVMDEPRPAYAAAPAKGSGRQGAALVSEAEKAFARADYRGAVEICDQALALDGGNAAARELRERANEEMRRAVGVCGVSCVTPMVMDEPRPAYAAAPAKGSGRQGAALVSEAEKAFARADYRGAVEICDQALALDGGNAAARELRERANEEMRRAAWRDLKAADPRSHEDERLKLREKLLWPDAITQYPDAETWERIKSRSSAQ